MKKEIENKPFFVTFIFVTFIFSKLLDLKAMLWVIGYSLAPMQPEPQVLIPLSIIADPGEAEAIALAQTIEDSIVLLDDPQATTN